MPADDMDCDCEFDPIPGDLLEGTPETAWHYRRTCQRRNTPWYSLHCSHEYVHQAHRPAWTRQMVARDAVLAYVDEIRTMLPDLPA